MRTSAAFASRHFTAFARCRLFVNVPRMLQGDLVMILKVLVMLMDLRMEQMKKRPLQPRPKLLQHGKKAQARGGAVAFVFEEVMAVGDVGKAAREVEWLGDTGSSRHVCTDLSLMWDVCTREKPILLRQVVGDIEVYTTGTVKAID